MVRIPCCAGGGVVGGRGPLDVSSEYQEILTAKRFFRSTFVRELDEELIAHKEVDNQLWEVVTGFQRCMAELVELVEEYDHQDRYFSFWTALPVLDDMLADSNNEERRERLLARSRKVYHTASLMLNYSEAMQLQAQRNVDVWKEHYKHLKAIRINHGISRTSADGIRLHKAVRDNWLKVNETSDVLELAISRAEKVMERLKSDLCSSNWELIIRPPGDVAENSNSFLEVHIASNSALSPVHHLQ
jgi:hypothetical protein